MTTITIKGTEYKIKYGFNSFADTDLLERVQDVAVLLNSKGVKNDADVSMMGQIRNLFVIVRELLYVGLEKYNPVESIQEVGDLLDDYREEGTEEDPRGLIDMFTLLGSELSSEGFLTDLLSQMDKAQSNITQIPQDHKKKVTKKTSPSTK